MFILLLFDIILIFNRNYYSKDTKSHTEMAG